MVGPFLSTEMNPCVATRSILSDALDLGRTKAAFAT